VTLNFIQVAAIVRQQRSRPYYDHYAEGKFAAFVTIARQIPKLTAPADVILCPIKLSRAMTFLTDRNVYEINEPIPKTTGKYFVVLDPADGMYMRWLENQHMVMDGIPIDSVPRLKGQPPVYLMSAHREAAPG
jgi:hypothetical protein